MQELAGRLSALDPEAGESLKVIAYFDTLIARGAGVDAALRGAATLSGTTAGAVVDGQVLRVGPDGARLGSDPAAGLEPGRHVVPAGPAHVWIERVGAAHANDELVLERLALAVGVVLDRRPSGLGDPVLVLLDGARPASDRQAAAARLRLGSRVRAVAVPLAAGGGRVVVGPDGPVRAHLLGADETCPHPRAGLGTLVAPTDLAASWELAQVALRLTDPARPVVDAAALGLVATAVAALRGGDRHPDVADLAALDPRSLELLDALADHDSVRAAAHELGMHHSSVQARHEALSARLGYDPRSSDGRVRYRLARLVLRTGADAG